MPTAAKLSAGIFLALTAVVASYVFIEMTPTIRLGSKFYLTNSAIGFFVGWKTIGATPPESIYRCFAKGLQSAIALAFVTLMTFSVWDVVEKLKQFIIKDMIGVPQSFMEAVIDFSEYFLNPTLIAVLFIGGFITSIFTLMAKRYR